MTSDPQIFMEISFNILYLAIIWLFVAVMTKKFGTIKDELQRIASKYRLAFFLLALGDTGHVGFRVIAYIRGGLETNSTLVGIGALSTAITVTLFYMVFVDIWKVNFIKEKDVKYYFLLIMGGLRFILMIPTQNEWGNVVPPFEWSVIRNIPLMILGLGVAYLMLRDGYNMLDTRYKYMSYCIFASFAFYIPVILYVQVIPMIGMLMIPKTIAYLIMAGLSYRYYFMD